MRECLELLLSGGVPQEEVNFVPLTVIAFR
jgi:hypothetical protein